MACKAVKGMGKGDDVLRRIALLFTLASVVATMVAVGASSSALAQTTTTGPVCTTTGQGVNRVQTCITTTTTKTTETEKTTVAGPPIVTNLANTSVDTPTTGPCEVGNSNREGTAEGISTQEFENISTQQTEITVTNTFETTTTTVKTETFRGNTNGRPLTSNTVTSPPVKVLTGTTTSDPVPVGDPVVTSTPIGDPVFTPTGRCQNVPGPQNEETVGNANPRALEPRPRGNQPIEELPVETPVEAPRGNRPVDVPRGQPEERIEEVLPVVDRIEEVL
jgi:hypothetical protein